MQEAMRIVFTSNHMSKSPTSREVFLHDAPPSSYMWCCHLYLSVIAAFHLCHHHSSIVIFAYGLELQVPGYIKHNFAPLWHINILRARNGRWFMMRGLNVKGCTLWEGRSHFGDTCHPAPSIIFQHLQWFSCHYCHHFSLIVANFTACSSVFCMHNYLRGGIATPPHILTSGEQGGWGL